MITVVLLTFVGMFAIAGTFISIEAKRRSERERTVSNGNGGRSSGRMDRDNGRA